MISVSLTKNDIDLMLKGSVTESLIGALPQSDMTFEDYRAERLNKYEAIHKRFGIENC